MTRLNLIWINQCEFIPDFDTLAEVLIKPELPEVVPTAKYPEANMTEIIDFETLISNVVTNATLIDYTPSLTIET